MNETAHEITREEKVLISVFGTLEELKSKGLMEGGAHQLTAEGQAAYQRLRAEGFEPTTEEVWWAMDVIQSAASESASPDDSRETAA